LTFSFERAELGSLLTGYSHEAATKLRLLLPTLSAAIAY